MLPVTKVLKTVVGLPLLPAMNRLSPAGGYSMTSLLSYIREGFRPQNPLLKNAGDPDDGSPDIGAVDMMNDIASGDIDGNGHMDLTDAIISLQFITGSSAINLNMQADVNQDNIIGIEETIYILQEISL